MLVANRRLLEWNPSGDSDRASRKDLSGACLTMWVSQVIAVGVAAYLALSRPEALVVALPVLAFWFISPLIAWWLSKPLDRREARLSSDQLVFLRKMCPKNLGVF